MTINVGLNGFHGSNDVRYTQSHVVLTGKQMALFTYRFENFFHPYAGLLIERLNTGSLAGMLDPAVQATTEINFFPAAYTLLPNSTVTIEHFPKQIDVAVGGPYANYNWELFYHVPLTIAVHLSKNCRYREAKIWFEFIFDPTANGPDPTPKRFWKFLAFRDAAPAKDIDELLALLSDPAGDPAEKATILAGYEAIRNKPFQPHAVARTRHLAYMYNVVMKYLDNLIAWGDHLFLQDTLETINEATQLYVLADNILGERPEQVPLKGTVRPKTFAQLQAATTDSTGNALVALEGNFPFNIGAPTGGPSANASGALFGLGRTLYFCVPRNEKLLGYWDLVQDRLFKIRNCMNIAGIVRPLALFDPPIDPALLVKAAAAGMDVGAMVAGLNQPASPVRAQLLIQKALELAGEVRSLGGSLLQAIEKGDAERLAVLRQGHEITLVKLQQDVRFLQWKQAQQATELLLRSRTIALERYYHYLHLLGAAPSGDPPPATLGLDRRELTEENFDEAHEALVGQYLKDVPLQAYPELSFASEDSASGVAGARGSGKLGLITSEGTELQHLKTGRNLGLAASAVDVVAGVLSFLPDFNINLHYWGIGATSQLKVGSGVVKVLEVASKVLNMTAAWNREQAGLASRIAGYERRAYDWTQQVNAAALELRQIGGQILGSLIGEQVAHREYRNVERQIEQIEEVDRFLHDKFSNVELYGWMQSELSRLYYEYYRFAFDVARRAEQTMKRELMRTELDDQTLIKFNYWDGGRKGLLSGEALHLDLKRMELAYHDHNPREYELTKHVSVLQVDPMALIALRATGRCTVRLPEALFDMDGPGQYARRIKSVALSIPCVTGPYVGVNCKLTLVKSSIRKSPLLLEGEYVRTGPEDVRFQDYFASVQSVVASSGQQDSGLFETNLRDERILPFEYFGAISEWQLELPGNPAKGEPVQFDYGTISDVILHIRYTAREAGILRTKAVAQIKTLIAAAQASGSIRLFSVPHEFPTQWARFKAQIVESGQRFELAFTPGPEHYPYWSQNLLDKVDHVDLFAESHASSVNVFAKARVRDTQNPSNWAADVPPADTLVKNDDLKLWAGRLSPVTPVPKPTDEIKLYFEHTNLDDLWIAVTWKS